MAAVEIEQPCVENRQSMATSSSSHSERSYGFYGMSPAVSSPATSSTSHRFTCGDSVCLLTIEERAFFNDESFLSFPFAPFREVFK